MTEGHIFNVGTGRVFFDRRTEAHILPLGHVFLTEEQKHIILHADFILLPFARGKIKIIFFFVVYFFIITFATSI